MHTRSRMLAYTRNKMRHSWFGTLDVWSSLHWSAGLGGHAVQNNNNNKKKKERVFCRMTSLSLKWAASTNTTSRRNKVYIRPHWHKRIVWILTHLCSYGRNMWLLENLKMKQSIICSPNPLLCFCFFQLKKKHPPSPQFLDYHLIKHVF